MNKLFTFFRESLIARSLIPFGLALIVFGTITFFITNGNKDYIETEATVTKLEIEQESYTDSDGNFVPASYKAYLKYTVNGSEYESDLSGTAGYKEGDVIKIFYNPNNPVEITQITSTMLPIILIIGGIAALIGGVMSGLNAIKRYKKLKEQEKGWANE